jgi:hypothetical protein
VNGSGPDEEGQVIRSQFLKIRDRVRGIRWAGMSERRVPKFEGSIKGLLDGVEFVLAEWVRHGDGAAIEGSDSDGLKRDNLGRRDYIARGSPIPVRRSKVPSRGPPRVSINLVFLRDIKSMALHHLLYGSINIMMYRPRAREEPRREQHRVCAKSGKAQIRGCSIRRIQLPGRVWCHQHHPTARKVGRGSH